MVLGARLLPSIGLALSAVLCARQAVASSYQVVAVVEGGRRVGISGPLAVDGVGNLYGEMQPDQNNSGEIFTLSVKSGYGRAKILYTYAGGQQQLGQFPIGGVTLDHGQVIGTTSFGGPDTNGTVFNLGEPSAPALTVLHGFKATPIDGSRPVSGLTPGLSHLFYGTTKYGGTDRGTGEGSVFESSGSAATPLYRVIFAFDITGYRPTIGRLAVDGQGRLYGETLEPSSKPSVFMLENTNGRWQETQLHFFNQPDGSHLGAPYDGNVVLDNAGNLYGCTTGGSFGDGAVFRLSPPASPGGEWQQTVLYNFGAQPGDPIDSFDYPACEITIDPASLTIVGTSRGGGQLGSGNPSAGTIWQLKPPLAGQTRWREEVEHSFFGGVVTDGGNPQYPPVQVGKTYYGGNSLSGAIYAFTPGD